MASDTTTMSHTKHVDTKITAAFSQKLQCRVTKEVFKEGDRREAQMISQVLKIFEVKGKGVRDHVYH